MLLTLSGPTADSYTLNFATPLTSLGFTRAMLLAATSSGVTSPQWTASAYSGSGGTGSLIASASENLLASFSSIAANTIVLAGAGTISSLRIDANAFNFAGFASPVLDDFILTSAVAAIPEPETYAMLLAGLGVLGFAARRRKLKEAA